MSETQNIVILIRHNGYQKQAEGVPQGYADAKEKLEQIMEFLEIKQQAMGEI